MVMNAGIYSMNNVPAGLWIEQGKELNALNTKAGKGNFHVQPNGGIRHCWKWNPTF